MRQKFFFASAGPAVVFLSCLGGFLFAGCAGGNFSGADLRDYRRQAVTVEARDDDGPVSYAAGNVRMVLERRFSWHTELPSRRSGGSYNSEVGTEFGFYVDGWFDCFSCMVKKANIRTVPGAGDAESSFRDVILIIRPGLETDWDHFESPVDPQGETYVTFSDPAGRVSFEKSVSKNPATDEFRILLNDRGCGFLAAEDEPALFFKKDHDDILNPDLKNRLILYALSVYESVTRPRNEFFELPD